MSKAILGGGLGGLSAAYYLSKKTLNHPLTLIEASNRTGGWIKSTPLENGVIFEQGPRTIRPRGSPGANTLQLIEELGLVNEINPISSNSPAAKNRMIYAKGGLHPLPSSLTGLFKRQDPFTKPLILHLLNDLKAASVIKQDEPIYDFVQRRFSLEVADYLISPLICGVCAGNAKEISVKFLMKQLFEYEQKYGSIAKGLIKNIWTRPSDSQETSLTKKAKQDKWSVYSFNNGCETLPIALNNHLLNKDNVNIALNTKCSEIIFDKEQIVLHLSNSETITVDHLISAIPAPDLAPLLSKQHPELSNYLKILVKNVSVAVINLHYRNKILQNPAFGFLVAPNEQLPILGVIYDSCCFPQYPGTVLTVMMGGYWFNDHFGDNPNQETLLNVALEHLQGILGTSEVPVQVKVNVLRNCLPQYVVGHEETLQRIEDYIDRNGLAISLCGASYRGVGINDVILSAKQAVEKIS